MVRFPFGLITILIASLTLCSTASSHKDVGGGNGVGGVLLDHIENKNTEVISIEAHQLITQHQGHIFRVFPLLEEFAKELLLLRKVWYLGDFSFISECENESMMNLKKEIIACQNDVEVRIQKSWWQSASPQSKSELVTHEIIRGLSLESKKSRSINGAVAYILRRDFEPRFASALFAQAGLPSFPTQFALRSLENHFSKLNLRLCDVHRASAAETFRAEALQAFYRSEVSGKPHSEALLDASEAYERFIPLTESLIKRQEFGPIFCELNQNPATVRLLIWESFKEQHSIFMQ